MKYNLQIVGVGGQGILFTSMVLGTAAMDQGMEVAMSEVHGMAQRGGSVTSTVRFGDDVLSPLISRGGADLILGFEPIETYRSLQSANEDTYIVSNTHPIVPITVSLGAQQYPSEKILSMIEELSSRALLIDATAVALEVGKAIVTNAVLIGAVASLKAFPLSRESLEEALLAIVPDKFGDLNTQAFAAGYEKAKGLQMEWNGLLDLNRHQ